MMKMIYSLVCSLLPLVVVYGFNIKDIPRSSTSMSSSGTIPTTNGPSLMRTSRRQMLERMLLVAGGANFASPNLAAAVTPTTVKDGNLPDLPAEGQRSYLQYRIPLQTSTDFYIFELQSLLREPSEWGAVGEMFQVLNNRGQGNPSRIEREFTNTFRILGLSIGDPEVADQMRDAQFRFEKAMAKISKATSGVRRDLPVEIDKDAVPKALEGWEEGRVALNEFLVALNSVTGLSEMKTIPEPGPDQFNKYGRSEKKYVELKKKIKLCQNRGGPTLSQGKKDFILLLFVHSLLAS